MNNTHEKLRWSLLLDRSLFRLASMLLVAPGLWLSLERAASAQVTGYERVIALSAESSQSYRSVTVSCPPGKQLVGTGAEVSSTHPAYGFQHVVLNDIVPNTALTELTVTAYEDDLGTSSSWYLRATANCADPLPGLDRIVATSPWSSVSPRSVAAVCPAGKVVVGAGAGISGGFGRVVLDDLRPSAALDNVVVTAYEDESGTGSSWALNAYAICAYPPAGIARIVESSVKDSNNKWVIAECPPGTVLLGSGGEITGGIGRVTMRHLGPPNPLFAGSYVVGLETLQGTNNTWRASSYAVCAPP